jgi:hypothetical protein
MPKIHVQDLVKELLDLDRWKQLADENRSAYRKAVKQLHSKINAVLKRILRRSVTPTMEEPRAG